jgi:hypothetical protein
MVESEKAFPGLDYDALEQAVMESSRGRWFLEEYAKRHRFADTRILLEAIHKLENAVLSHAVAAPAGAGETAELNSLLQVIRKTRTEIASVRNHLLPDGGALQDDAEIYERMAESARSAAHALMAQTETINSMSASLKAADPARADVAVIENQASELQSLAWKQDVLSQRIAKAMGLLAHLDDHITAATGARPRSAKPSPPGPESLSYFIRDEEIFEPAAAKPSPAMKVIAAAAPSARDPVTPARQPEPAVQPRTPEPDAAPKRAHVIVKRLTPSSPAGEQQAIDPAAAGAVENVPQPASPPAAAMKSVTVTEPAPERKRVVIIRRKTSETAEIPLANDVPASAVG